MTRTLICIVLLLIYTNFKSQVKSSFPLEIKYDTISLKINNDTQNYISAKRLITNKLITNVYFDSSFIFGLLKEYENEDTYADLFSLKQDNPEIYSTRELNLSKDQFKFFGDFMQIDGHSIDLKTLTKKWKVPFDLFETNNSLNIGICRNKTNLFNFKDGIVGIDLKTGLTKWTNENIKLSYGVMPIQFLKDSIFIFISDKLYGVNVLNGKHWESKHSFFGKCYIYPNHGKCYCISNSIVDKEGKFYIANESAVLKFDFLGNLEKEIKFKEEQSAALSQLYLLDSLLIFINTGLAFLNSEPAIIQRTPFVQIFNLKGEEKAFFSLGHSNIEKTVLLDKTLYIFQKNLLLNLDLSSLKILTAKEFKNKVFKTIKDVLKVPVFIRDGNNFKLISPLDNKNVYLIKDDGSLLVLDDQLNLINEISSDSTYYVLYKDGNITAVHNVKNKFAFILSKVNKVILEFEKVKDIFNSKNTLIINKSNQLLFIQLDKISTY